MSIKTIVFDFGRVIGFFDHRRTTEKLVAHTELKLAELHALLYAGKLEDDYEAGRMSSAEFVKQVQTLCRLTCAEDSISQAWADIFWPNEEVCALIPKLKPYYRLVLGSNTSDLHARQFLTQFAETLAYFDEIVLSYKIGVRKPDCGFFKHCQSKAQCAPAECLFIDDMPANVAGAKACGWNALVYSDFPGLRKDLLALGIKGL